MDLIQKINEDIKNNSIGKKLLYNEIEINNNIVFLLDKLKKIKIDKENIDLFYLLLYFNELDLNNINNLIIKDVFNNINISKIKELKYLYKLLEINQNINFSKNKNNINYKIENEIILRLNKELLINKNEQEYIKKILDFLNYSEKYNFLYKNSDKDNFFKFIQNKEKLIFYNIKKFDIYDLINIFVLNYSIEFSDNIKEKDFENYFNYNIKNFDILEKLLQNKKINNYYQNFILNKIKKINNNEIIDFLQSLPKGILLENDFKSIFNIIKNKKLPFNITLNLLNEIKIKDFNSNNFTQIYEYFNEEPIEYIDFLYVNKNNSNNYDVFFDFLINNPKIVEKIIKDYSNNLFLKALENINNRYEEKIIFLKKHFPNIYINNCFSTNDIIIKALENKEHAFIYHKISFDDYKYFKKYIKNDKNDLIMTILTPSYNKYYNVELKKYLKELFVKDNKDIVFYNFNFLYTLINDNNYYNILNNYLNEIKQENKNDFYKLILENIDIETNFLDKINFKTDKAFIEYINKNGIKKDSLYYSFLFLFNKKDLKNILSNVKPEILVKFINQNDIKDLISKDLLNKVFNSDFSKELRFERIIEVKKYFPDISLEIIYKKRNDFYEIFKNYNILNLITEKDKKYINKILNKDFLNKYLYQYGYKDIYNNIINNDFIRLEDFIEIIKKENYSINYIIRKFINKDNFLKNIKTVFNKNKKLFLLDNINNKKEIFEKIISSNKNFFYTSDKILPRKESYYVNIFKTNNSFYSSYNNSVIFVPVRNKDNIYNLFYNKDMNNFETFKKYFLKYFDNLKKFKIADNNSFLIFPITSNSYTKLNIKNLINKINLLIQLNKDILKENSNGKMVLMNKYFSDEELLYLKETLPELYNIYKPDFKLNTNIEDNIKEYLIKNNLKITQTNINEMKKIFQVKKTDINDTKITFYNKYEKIEEIFSKEAKDFLLVLENSLNKIININYLDFEEYIIKDKDFHKENNYIFSNSFFPKERMDKYKQEIYDIYNQNNDINKIELELNKKNLKNISLELTDIYYHINNINDNIIKEILSNIFNPNQDILKLKLNKDTIIDKNLNYKINEEKYYNNYIPLLKFEIIEILKNNKLNKLQKKILMKIIESDYYLKTVVKFNFILKKDFILNNLNIKTNKDIIILKDKFNYLIKIINLKHLKYNIQDINDIILNIINNVNDINIKEKLDAHLSKFYNNEEHFKEELGKIYQKVNIEKKNILLNLFPILYEDKTFLLNKDRIKSILDINKEKKFSDNKKLITNFYNPFGFITEKGLNEILNNDNKLIKYFLITEKDFNLEKTLIKYLYETNENEIKYIKAVKDNNIKEIEELEKLILINHKIKEKELLIKLEILANSFLKSLVSEKVLKEKDLNKNILNKQLEIYNKSKKDFIYEDYEFLLKISNNKNFILSIINKRKINLSSIILNYLNSFEKIKNFDLRKYFQIKSKLIKNLNININNLDNNKIIDIILIKTNLNKQKITQITNILKKINYNDYYFNKLHYLKLDNLFKDINFFINSYEKLNNFINKNKLKNANNLINIFYENINFIKENLKNKQDFTYKNINEILNQIILKQYNIKNNKIIDILMYANKSLNIEKNKEKLLLYPKSEINQLNNLLKNVKEKEEEYKEKQGKIPFLKQIIKTNKKEDYFIEIIPPTNELTYIQGFATDSCLTPNGFAGDILNNASKKLDEWYSLYIYKPLPYLSKEEKNKIINKLNQLTKEFNELLIKYDNPIIFSEDLKKVEDNIYKYVLENFYILGASICWNKENQTTLDNIELNEKKQIEINGKIVRVNNLNEDFIDVIKTIGKQINNYGKIQLLAGKKGYPLFTTLGTGYVDNKIIDMINDKAKKEGIKKFNYIKDNGSNYTDAKKQVFISQADDFNINKPELFFNKIDKTKK